MEGDDVVVPAEVGGRQILDKIEQPQPRFGGNGGVAAKVLVQKAVDLRVSVVRFRRLGDDQTARDILEDAAGLVEVAGEVVLADVQVDGVRDRDPPPGAMRSQSRAAALVQARMISV